jgi:energy-coupling factor transporter transmembrane protein EcfT
MKEFIKKHWKKIIIIIVVIIIIIFVIWLSGMGIKSLLSIFGVVGTGLLISKMSKKIANNNKELEDEKNKIIANHNNNDVFDKQFVLDRKRARDWVDSRETGKKR